ncbi:hypothetical protein LCGC14_2740100 [marine sediment metagenome]|uniref:Uncharacterized protein n=1 Tax=marine sediment metagenome TaxID=412755 RepID=A0A0F8ZRU7_9ZZZZ
MGKKVIPFVRYVRAEDTADHLITEPRTQPCPTCTGKKDRLEDKDIPFPPKSTRTVKAKIISRKRGEFITDTEDRLDRPTRGDIYQLVLDFSYKNITLDEVTSQIKALIPDKEEIVALRKRLTELEEKLDDREADLLKATEDEKERIHTDLASFVDMLKRAPEMHGDIQADIPQTQQFIKYW